MQRMWRQMFAAVLGVAALAGASAAQSPPPRPLPPIVPIAAPVAVTPAPAAAVPHLMPAVGLDVPAQAPAPAAPAPAAPGTVVPPPAANTAYGVGVHGCNNGCGTFKQDCTFMFGSCKSFFNPCASGAADCGGFGLGRFHGGHCGGGLFGHHGKCPDLPWGTPYGTGHSGCKYSSWLNH